MIARAKVGINTEYGLELRRERRTTMDGKRFSKCTTNTSNNEKSGVAEDGDGIASCVVYLRLKGHWGECEPRQPQWQH